MAPHRKVNITQPHEEIEIASECRYMNQCTNVPMYQMQTDIRVRFYYLLIIDT